ncbi:MAG: hypothetical protein QN168_02790 [Armatimonadota bacterium]|nr:hypothetical protein [Armatimonadota bacterium]
MPIPLAPLQALVSNPLPEEVPGALVALIGDHPSAYSRSPRIWTPVFRHLGIDAAYLPLDVPPGRLEAVLAILRETDACLGANVTMPYKEAVVPLLDDLDAVTSAVGAVNTIVRSARGRLAGTNTDGVGLVAALLHPGTDGPLVETLYGHTVLLIGGGGAARAAAVALVPLVGTGELLVTNRTAARAEDVAARARAAGGRARAIPEDDLDEVLPAVDLVINASLRGQAGIRQTPQGWTCLEPYSALAPADPPVLPRMPEEAFMAAWRARARAGVEANHARSQERVHRLPRGAAVFDMIYAPAETPLVRHARDAGLRAANGRWMNIAQAVEACVAHVCARRIAEIGIDREAARAEVTRLMAEAWDGQSP